MAWTDKINNPLRIITGDGKEWLPLAMEQSNQYSYEFNVSEFEFPEVSGTLVDRGLPKGRRFPLEIYFNGAENVEQGEAFRISANDPREWVVFHPIYGRIDGHPISIGVDSSGINSVKIKISFVESIATDGPRTTEDAQQTILNFSDQTLVLASDVFSQNITPTSTDANFMGQNVNSMYNDSVGTISDNDIAADYQNVFTKASSAINTAIGNTSFAIQDVQNFITYPFLFSNSVQQRLVVLVSQLNTLSDSVVNILTINEKGIFENFKSSVLLSMVKTAVSPIGNEYQNAPDVVNVITILIDSYNKFIDELNFLKSENGLNLDSWNPDYELQNELNYAVNFTVSSLYQIALNAQQERSIFLETDSNVIIQTHRFYGIDVEDVNVNRFIQTNNVSLKELIQLKKGRKIVYYV